MAVGAQPNIAGRERIGERLDDSRLHVVIVESLYLCILFAVAALYVTGKWVPPTLVVKFPIGVVWFGAVGAVLISLTGAVEHRNDWDPSWNFWHYTRPLVGAVLAIVSWLIFQAGILAVGSNPTPTATGGTATSNILYYIIAFIVGYREETFRDLIKRVTDVIFSPKSAPQTAQAAITQINPATGRAVGGDKVVISGTGFTGVTGVKFGDAAAASFHVDSDGQITVTTPPGAVGVVRVTVSAGSGSTATGDFTYT